MYDNAGRPTTLQDPGYNATLTYTADSQIATVTVAGKTTTYGYDNASRLASAAVTQSGTTLSSAAYTWDGDGNRASIATNGATAVTATYDLADKLTATSDGVTYTYNTDGQQTGAGVTTYGYNAFGELTSATPSVGTAVSYTRDALGRAAARMTGSNTETLSYDNTTTQLAASQQAGVTTNLIRTPTDGRLIAEATGTAVKDTGLDFHGDLVALKTDTSTSITWQTGYDPFGNPTSTTGTNPVNLGYQAQYTDPTSGLVDMAARSYSPTTGRFTTLDTQTGHPNNPTTLNRYLYANADPIDNSDPEGHDPCPHGGGGCANDGTDPATTQTPAPSDCNGTFCYQQPPNYSSDISHTSGACTSDNACSQRQQICDFACQLNAQLQRSALPGKDNLDSAMPVLNRLGYDGSPAFTYQDAIQFASQGQDQWYFVCEQVFHHSYTTCQNDPFEKHDTKKELAGAALIVGAYALSQVCAFILPICADAVSNAALEGVSPGSTAGIAGAGAGGAGAGVAALDHILGPADSADAAAIRAAFGLCTGSTGNSFVADTPVLMADGRIKPISQIKIGDRVLATDPISGTTKPQQVSALHLNQDTEFADVIYRGQTGRTATINTTQHHPFWDDTRRAWIDAVDLRPGDALHTPDGSTVTVVAVRAFTGSHLMYNLTIATIHTYYVVAGQALVLVHNSCGIGRDLIDGQAQQHIISGDLTGGGHKWPGAPGKTVFPPSWDTDLILDNVADVATSPTSRWTWQTGAQGSLYTRAGSASRVAIQGTVDGVTIKVIFEPATDRIVTAYPLP